MKILFVCTGNTCRSPMAEALFNSMNKCSSAESAGICVFEGGCAEQRAVECMREIKLDISRHKSRGITHEMLEEADLVLVMQRSHKRALLSAVPEFEDKIYTLSEYAEAADGECDGVKDPYGGSLEVYRDCRQQISDLILKITEKINGNHI